jgi:hypothetical protein
MKNIWMLTDALEMWQRRSRSFGDYSVTTLLKPPRVVHLEKRYGNLVTRPPESLIAAFMGHGIHSAFEENLKMKSILDPRYDIERSIMDKIEDRIISGRFDVLWDGEHLYDFKTCKTWKKVFDPNMVEWHQQLNVYAHLLRNRGLDIKTINIVALYMDWSRMRALRDKDYPQSPVVEYELNTWPDEVAGTFLRERINIMKEAEDKADASLPLCTTEERWMRFENGTATQFAVMSKPAAVRALKVCNTLDEAHEVAANSKAVVPGVSFIEVRYAVAKRCEDFCAVNNYCTQYQEYMTMKTNSNLTDKIML